MTQPNDDVDPAVVAELDAAGARARSAFERKDLAAYISLFSPDLRYRRADGQVLDGEQLRHDARALFRRFDWGRVSSTRTGLAASNGRVEESSIVTITLGMSLLFVHRSATYTRRCRTVWREADGRWLVDEFDVLDERFELGPLRFGLRAPRD